MRKGGEITGFAQVVKPYVLRNGAAKAFNSSCESSGFSFSLTDIY
jgi:nitrous oxide reductase accessory protein NosL